MATSGKGWARAMSVTLFVLAVIAAGLLPTDPLIAARMHDIFAFRRQAPEQTGYDYAAQGKDDIRLGSEFPRSGPAAEVKKLAGKSKRGYLVVGLGDCAGCTQFSLRRWDAEARAEGVPLLAFTLSSVKDINKFKQEAGTRVPMVTDNGNGIHKAINCYWGGRVYYYSSRWTLRWQTNWRDSNKNLDQIPELLAMIRGAR